MSSPPRRATAGFVLAGGRSTRMGRDKALLPLDGEPMLVRIARRVEAAAGSATVIGPPDRYEHLGFEVVPDRMPEAGPLAGIDTALSLNRAAWNLILACDLPLASGEILDELLDRASRTAALCVIPRSDRPEPLCAAYSIAAAPAIRTALESGVRKVTEALAGLAVEWYPVRHDRAFTNLNTVHEWEAFLG
jgi:molybdopterin-guanine dinucleotide biosynthesis protein A